MRAIYYPSQIEDGIIEIVGEKLHHLINVLRIQKGESLLLLNGTGDKIRGTVIDIQKKVVVILIEEKVQVDNNLGIDIAIGVPKREALELCLKQIVEIGIRNVYLVKSDFSQNKSLEKERIDNLLVSALEQSNNTHLPSVFNEKWSNIPWIQYDVVVLMDSQSKEGLIALQKKDVGQKILLLIGPEGGFSPSEIDFFEGIPNLSRVKLPTSIMRTPTALAVGVGFIIGRLLD